MNRRQFLTALATITAARSLLAASGLGSSRLGLASFSCHQHWKAARDGKAAVKFTDARSFYDFARSLGADGVQTSLQGKNEVYSRSLGDHVTRSGGYLEGDLNLPQVDADLTDFDRQLGLLKAAGVTVARSVFTSSRRYESGKSRADFLEFHRQSERRLIRVIPLIEKHKIKLAIENHKDHLAAELVSILNRLQNPWLGVTLDTGNNLALLEDPHAVIQTLAPFAFTVHLKDMAVQPHDSGFQLSEVPFGKGFLDLNRIVQTLRAANPRVIFNIEMATRDPLVVPCRAGKYWTTFPGRDESSIHAMLQLVQAHPPQSPPPRISGKSVAEILADEEANNRHCLDFKFNL